MKRYCLARNLVDDPQLTNEYEEGHKNALKEITASIKDSDIFRHGDLRGRKSFIHDEGKTG